MEVVPLLIIAASGLCAVSSRSDREYHFVYEKKDWTEAQSYCRETYTDLATIHSLEDMNILNNMVDLGKMGVIKVAWIGLYHDMDNWRWSLSDRNFYKKGETEFRRWSPGQPENYTSQKNCTVMDSNGKWHTENCENYAEAICMDVKGTEGWQVSRLVRNKTWTEAQSYCRTHYTDLVSVRNMEENTKVRRNVPSWGKAWIGLFRDPWKWSDGSSSSFVFWKPHEPDNRERIENCVGAYFDMSGKWADRKCGAKSAFICYKQHITSKQLIKVSLQTDDPSLDLSDPAVMEGILQQLKQRMKAQGLDEGIKLTWKKQPDGKVFHKEEEEETKKRNTKEKKEEL